MKAIMVTAVVSFLSAASVLAQEPGTEATTTVMANPRLAEELRIFLPLISMDTRNPLMAGTHAVADVLQLITDLNEKSKIPLNAHTLLESSRRDVVSFLVQSRGRLTPAMEDVHPPTISVDPAAEPELAVLVLLFDGFMEAMKHEAIRDWQSQFDGKCRKAYHDLMPVIRAASKGEKPLEPPVRIEGTFTKQEWVFLRAVNTSGKDLADVTLAVKLETLDGQSAEHYYYLPKWANGEKFPLRPAADWLHVGAAATTSARVEIVSDKIEGANFVSKIDDHIPTAADMILAGAESQIPTGRHLKTIIAGLDHMEGSLRAYKEREDRRQDLRHKAGELFNGAVAALNKQITDETTKRTKLRNERDRAKNKEAAARFDAPIKKCDENIKQWQARLAALNNGTL